MVKPFPQKALYSLANLQDKALSGSRGRRRPASFKGIRVFKSPIPEINTVYHNINRRLAEANVSNPFSYDKEADTHILTIREQLRFKRKSDDLNVSMELFDYDNQSWVPWSFVFDENVKDFNRFVKLRNSSTSTSGASNNFDISLVDVKFSKNIRDTAQSENFSRSVYGDAARCETPIMWPIKNFSSGSASNAFQHFFNSVVKEESTILYDNRKDIIKKNNLSDADYLKKLMQMSIVLNSKWGKKNYNQYKMNLRFATKKWWLNFVDRDLLKVLVSVYGRKNINCITWCSYSAISSIPEIKKVMSNISLMGPEKQFLSDLNFNDWAKTTKSDLVPQEWEKRWSSVTNLPFSVSESIIGYINKSSYPNSTASSPFTVFSNMSFNDDLDKIPKNKMPLLDIWDAFSCIKDNFQSQTKKVKPRDMILMWNACLITNAVEGNSFDKYSKTHIVEDIEQYASFVTRCINIWKVANPKNYRHWPQDAQQNWTGFVNATWNSTVSNGGDFALDKKRFDYDRCNAIDTKINLSKAMKEMDLNSKVKRKKKKI